MNSARNISHLRAVERFVLWLSAGLLLASLPTHNPRAQIGALAGAALSMFNARVIAVLGAWAQNGPPETAKQRLGMLLLGFQLKLGFLALCIYLAVRYLPVAPLWLVIGLSLLPVGILLRAVSFRPGASDVPGGNPDEGERAIRDHG